MQDKTSLLFVDDDPKAGDLLRRFCEGSAYDCHVFRDARKALDYFCSEGADLIITDLRMPDMNGIELLAEIRGRDTEIPVIIVTAHSSLESAIDALRLGATDFLKKPFDMEELLLLADKTLERVNLRRENRLLRRQLQQVRNGNVMIGSSAVMEKVYSIISKISDIRCNVLIQGESGTGKELVAQAIHQNSPAADQPFVVIDCGALSDTLLESELFGHEKGAFTGAVGSRQGLLEAARGGTVFLDEIGNISDAMQMKLLRVIQEQQVTRVGSIRPVKINVRFLAASNRDLEEMVQAGEFRADLYHRLNVVKITIPPLRERAGDIPFLVEHFVAQFAAEYGRNVTGFDEDSMQRLLAYHWPGNVRELRNTVEKHVALAGSPVMVLEDIVSRPAMPDNGIDADLPTLAELERRYLIRTLDRFDGNRTRAASALGIDKSTLWRKMQLYTAEDRSGQPQAD
jgi:DNA-binding NtrC family response regulator